MYLVDQIHDIQPELVIPFFPVLNEFLLRTSNQSKKRHILRIFSIHEVPNENMALLLDFCIQELTNASQPIAVRVHGMQILYNIALKEPDFAGELIDIIENEIEYHGSAGIANRGTKLVARLRRLRTNRL